jgi:hypothetical protein
MGKYYEIPCTWEVYGTIEIEADSLEEAIELAERDDSPMPDDSDYVDGSFQVDRDIAEEINKDE